MFIVFQKDILELPLLFWYKDTKVMHFSFMRVYVYLQVIDNDIRDMSKMLPGCAASISNEELTRSWRAKADVSSSSRYTLRFEITLPSRRFEGTTAGFRSSNPALFSKPFWTCLKYKCRSCFRLDVKFEDLLHFKTDLDNFCI